MKQIKMITTRLIYIIIPILFLACQFDAENNSDESEKQQVSMDANLSQGEIYFRNYCSNCHHINLREPLTASPLGRISDFRETSYLISSVKNFMNEVSNGNPIAKCQYERYAKLVMLPFEFLTEKEIKEIFNFIDLESKQLNISLQEMEVHHNCDGNKWLNLDSLSKQQMATIDSSEKEKMINAFKDYFFSTYKFSPYSNYNDAEYNMDRFSITILPKEEKVMKVYQINYENKRIGPLYYLRDKYYFQYPAMLSRETTEKFPASQDIHFIVLEESGNDQLSFGRKSVALETINTEIVISTKQMAKTDIKKYIK